MARLRFIVGLGCALLSASVCRSAVAQAIVVGAKEFTEQLLVAELTTQLLAARGYDVHKGTGFGTEGLRTLQQSGVIDIYWEYSGTALSNFYKDTVKRARDDGYERVRDLDAKRGLVWLAPSKVNNTYSLAMRREDAAARGVGSISDLATKVRQGEGIKVASTLEFPGRPDGLKALEQAYRFKFMLGFVVGMDSGAVYRALRRNSEFDVGVVFATDARIAAADLIVLRDDWGAFADYILAPVIRQTTLEQHPALKIILESLSGVLDNNAMRTLNSAVDVQGRTLEAVASEFLRSRALVESP